MNNKMINYSVIMPVYNGKEYFGEALDSALTALGPEDEIIVIEDGSKDGGVGDIIKAAKDHRIRYVIQENGGVASALNHGLKIATNPYFAWLSHDDLFLPNRLQDDRKLREIAADIVTFSAFYLFTNHKRHFHLVNNRELATSHQFATRLLARRFLNGCTVTAPISTITEFGLFDETLRHTQDYDMWLRILEKQNFTYIESPTVLSRQHANQDSKKMPSDARNEFMKTLKKHISKIRLRKSTVLDILILIAIFFKIK